MNDRDELRAKVINAYRQDLIDLIIEWMERDETFQKFVRHKLLPPVDEIDFRKVLARVVRFEDEIKIGRERGHSGILNWGNVSLVVGPWCKQAGEYSAGKLFELIEAIITCVGMKIRDEDFEGDDWYGDDYSWDIDEIMCMAGNLAGELLTREELADEYLTRLDELAERAEKCDVVHEYVHTPYALIHDLVSQRRTAGRVTAEMYETLIRTYPVRRNEICFRYYVDWTARAMART